MVQGAVTDTMPNLPLKTRQPTSQVTTVRKLQSHTTPVVLPMLDNPQLTAGCSNSTNTSTTLTRPMGRGVRQPIKLSSQFQDLAPPWHRLKGTLLPDRQKLRRPQRQIRRKQQLELLKTTLCNRDALVGLDCSSRQRHRQKGLNITLARRII